MALNFLTQIFGSRNERLLKQYRKTVAQINALEPTLEKLSDEALRAKTDEFKSRVANGETLDALLPEAYAVVREASKRVMKMRHFDVQMLGGIALHQGDLGLLSALANVEVACFASSRPSAGKLYVDEKNQADVDRSLVH